MKTLPTEASDETILAAIEEWVGLLVEERYEEAHHFFVDVENNPWEWSPQLLQTIIRTGVFADEHGRNRVTPIDQARGGLIPHRDVNRHDDNPQKGYIWFDLPLNGQWSDVTALLTFRIINQRLVIELESIDVM